MLLRWGSQPAVQTFCTRGRKMWGIIFRLFLNLPIPKIISHKNCQFWSILPNLWWQHLCQVCEAIVFVFCSNFPTLFQFSWHFSNIRDRVCRVCTHVPCGTGLLASAPPSSSPLRPYKPGSASEPSLLYYVPGFGIARHCKSTLLGIARHCTQALPNLGHWPLDASGSVVHCGQWTNTHQCSCDSEVGWRWLGQHVEGFSAFFWSQHFDPNICGMIFQARDIQSISTVSTVCEVFMVAASSKETSPRVYCLRRARVFQCLVFQCLDRV